MRALKERVSEKKEQVCHPHQASPLSILPLSLSLSSLLFLTHISSLFLSFLHFSLISSSKHNSPGNVNIPTLFLTFLLPLLFSFSQFLSFFLSFFLLLLSLTSKLTQSLYASCVCVFYYSYVQNSPFF